MNYYERYCGDYQRDTAHLSLAEHGAYTMLLDTYFSVEKPLPSDLPSLYRVCRAMTRLEQQAVKAVAEQFFPVSETDGLRHNRRADREIAKARPKIEAARINGRKGGRPPGRASHADRSPPPDSPDFSGAVTPSDAIPCNANKPTGFAPGYPDPSSGKSHGQARPEPVGKTPQPQPQHHPQPQSQHHPQPHLPSRGECGGEFLPEGGESSGPLNPSSVSLPPAQGCAINGGKEAGVPALSGEKAGVVEGAPGNGQAGAGTGLAPAQADACCRNLRGLGIRDCNPRHPVFLALLRAGAAEEEFRHAACAAVERGKASFAYVVGTVKRQREEAAEWSRQRRRAPNRQEQLEAANGAAAQRWLPPELRGEGAGRACSPRQEAGDADR